MLFTAGLFQFVTYACYFNLTPLYPLVGRDLRLDAGALGALVAAGGIVSVLVQIPGGSGGDRWGRRPFFAASLLLLALAQVGRWLAQDAPTFLLAQLLSGVALGVVGVNGWALIADSSAGARRRQGQSFGILNASLSLGLVGGYLLAGGLGSVLGWRLMSLALVGLPVLAVPAVLWIPPRVQEPSVRRPSLAEVLRSLGHRQRLALAGVAALTLSAGQGAMYLLPFGAQQRELGPMAAALLLVPYVVGSVIAGPLGGRVADRYGTRRVILTTLTMGAAACALLLWGAGSSILLVICFTCIGGSVNGALPQIAVDVVALGDTAGVGMGTIMAGLRMGQSLGSFLGPLVAGAVLAHAGLDAGWLAQAGCLVASLALYQVGSREPRGYRMVATAQR